MEYCASFVWFELSQGKEEGEAGGKVEEGCGVSQHWVCGEELIEPGAPSHAGLGLYSTNRLGWKDVIILMEYKLVLLPRLKIFPVYSMSPTHLDMYYDHSEQSHFSPSIWLANYPDLVKLHKMCNNCLHPSAWC